MIKTAKYAAAAMIVALVGAPSSAHAFQVFTSRAAWEAALYGTGFFLSDDLNDGANPLTDGATVTFATSQGSITQGFVDIGGGNYVIQDHVVGSNGTTATVFDFTRSMYAFGADFNIPFAGVGSGLSWWVDFTADGNPNAVQALDGSSNPIVLSGGSGFSFFGIVGQPDILTERFTSLELRGVSGTEGEKYQMDNLAYAPVPLPAAAWLLLSGLVGFVALGRRRGSEEASAAAA